MNHAFLFQVHAYPTQIREIIDLLSANNHYFFINVDKKVNDSAFKAALKGCSNVYFTEGKERIRVNHAGFSQIACTLQLLKLAQAKQMDYVHLLSGQDYPCVSNQEFDDFFEKCGNRSFMHYDSPEEALIWSKKKYPDRYRKYYACDMPGRNHLIIKGIVVLLNKILKKVSPIRADIKNVAAGWSWFTWHNSVVDYVLSYISDNPVFLERFKYTSCCDEVIFHTILNGMDKELNIEKYNSLRFIEWHPKRPYKSLPLILDEHEYDEIINCGAFFCRKIHPVESATLKVMLRKRISGQ